MTWSKLDYVAYESDGKSFWTPINSDDPGQVELGTNALIMWNSVASFLKKKKKTGCIWELGFSEPELRL